MKKKDKYKWELIDLLSRISRDKKLLDEFLIDLLTPKEYRELVIRWQIVKRLKAEMSHREIAEDLCTSIATITRGSRELLDQGGGFNQVFNKFRNKN